MRKGGEQRYVSPIPPPSGDSALPHPSAETSNFPSAETSNFGPLGLQGMHGPYFLLEVDSRPKFSYLGLFFLDPGSWEKEAVTPPPSPHLTVPAAMDQQQKQ